MLINLKLTISNKDEVMIVKILNLLKSLLLNNIGIYCMHRNRSSKIFQSKTLLECLRSGLQIEYTFVRTHFISFVEGCLPIFTAILDQNTNLYIASSLISTTCDFLYKKMNYYTKIFNDADHGEKPVSSDIFKRGSMIFPPNYLEEYKDVKSIFAF